MKRVREENTVSALDLVDCLQRHPYGFEIWVQRTDAVEPFVPPRRETGFLEVRWICCDNGMGSVQTVLSIIYNCMQAGTGCQIVVYSNRSTAIAYAVMLLVAQEHLTDFTIPLRVRSHVEVCLGIESGDVQAALTIVRGVHPDYHDAVILKQ
jgi:hypothetical protein